MASWLHPVLLDIAITDQTVAQVAGVLMLALIGWCCWLTRNDMGFLVLKARIEPMLDVFYKDLGVILQEHPGHHSLSRVEQAIYDRFQERTASPSDDELEMLRRAADREAKDKTNPSDLRQGFALLQGACRSEQQARQLRRHTPWLFRWVWNFLP